MSNNTDLSYHTTTHLNLSKYINTSLSPEIGNFVHLTHLDLTFSRLTCLPPEIGNLVRLTHLELCGSPIAGLPPEIGNLVSLTRLELDSSQITCLPPEIGNLVSLTSLDLSGGLFHTLPPEIGNLAGLTSLELCGCLCRTLLPEIGNLTGLTHLDLTFSRLASLPPEIGNLVHLVHLELDSCQITSLPPEIGNLVGLTYCDLSGCQIDYIPPNVERLLNRLENIRQLPIRGGIYIDRQSVHNHNIQRDIRESVMNLLRDPNPPILERIVIDIVAHPNITTETKEQLMEYINCSDVHSVLNITFGEMLCYVWKRIIVSEHCDEMLNILNTEMSDAHCMCFTGRISRLVNTLNGFYDDIVIRISDSEQIANIIEQIRINLERNNEYSVESHINLVSTMMGELGHSEEIILEWTSYID